jgi:hypothetical protein
MSLTGAQIEAVLALKAAYVAVERFRHAKDPATTPHTEYARWYEQMRAARNAVESAETALWRSLMGRG